MEQPSYDFNQIDESLSFSFESTGKRNVEKRVIFQKLDIENYYQVALVDLKEDGTFDDKIVSNNGDRDTVLATVFQMLNHFSRCCSIICRKYRVSNKTVSDCTKLGT
jgi:hypothetical protein